MAFGKKSLSRLPPEVLEKLKENREDKLVHQTEVKMLRVVAPGSPLGDASLVAATERVMTGQTKPCTRCGQQKDEVVLANTGTCEACWSLFA